MGQWMRSWPPLVFQYVRFILDAKGVLPFPIIINSSKFCLHRPHALMLMDQLQWKMLFHHKRIVEYVWFRLVRTHISYLVSMLPIVFKVMRFLKFHIVNCLDIVSKKHRNINYSHHLYQSLTFIYLNSFKIIIYVIKSVFVSVLASN